MNLNATLKSLRAVGMTGPEDMLPSSTDDPDLPIFLCFPVDVPGHNYDTAGASGCGAAFGEVEARLKAVAECLESFCFVNSPDAASSRACFGARDGQVDPAQFLTAPKEANHPLREAVRKSELCWARALDLGARQDVEVPSQLVFDVPDVVSEPKIRAERISCGMALGPAGSGMARMNGLFEIVERDALTGAYLRNRSARRIVGLASPVSDLVRQLENKGVESVLLDLTSDLGAPTVAALCVDRSGLGPALTAGAACRESYAEAAEKALLEAVQSRAARRALMRDGLPEIDPLDESSFGGFERVVYWCDPAHLDALDFWLAGDAVIAYADVADVRVSSRDVLQAILARGWSVYEVDVTLPEISAGGYEVKKILCPELHASYAAESAKTLFSAHYGHLEDIRNTPPHPFV